MFGHTRQSTKVAALHTAQYGRWGGLYETDPHSALAYRLHNSAPPPNEFERLVGLTRLGTLLLRGLDSLRPLFDEQIWRAQVDITRDVLRQLRDESKAADSELLVLVIRSIEDYPSPGKHVLMGLNLLEELRIPYLEVPDLINIQDHFPVDMGHWNNSGHRIVGELLTECIDAFFAAGSLAACDSVILP